MTRAFGIRNPGVQAALGSAVLFGAGAPAAKLLLSGIGPWMLAGLLYCGSGLGLGLLRLIRRAPRVRLDRADLAPLAGAVVAGGVIAPVLLLVGLAHLPASGASLLLNAEAVFTAVLAWVVFKENVDRRVALGMAAIIAGAVLIAVPQGAQLGGLWPSLAIIGACAAWGLDNNLTRRVALTDAVWLAAVKGGVAGPTNLVLAVAAGATWPAPGHVGAALLVGFLAYGVSLALFIIGLRHLGTARAGAYFSVAPFFGAALAVLLGDPVTWQLTAAAVLMAVGVGLHLTERHQHRHHHQPVTHEHPHTHDDGHHDHLHPAGLTVDQRPGSSHSHRHTHSATTHAHPHYPDSHHRHGH